MLVFPCIIIESMPDKFNFKILHIYLLEGNEEEEKKQNLLPQVVLFVLSETRKVHSMLSGMDVARERFPQKPLWPIWIVIGLIHSENFPVRGSINLMSGLYI